MAKAKQGPRLTPVGADESSRQSRPCGVHRLLITLEKLDADLAAEFRAAIALPKYEFTDTDLAKQMNVALRPFGLTTSPYIIGRHRRGECVTCHV